ncbi:MAG: ISL3 family transposase [Candidatus Polarisedimenticolaceae bacterium]|nr:ISL3 family transposase [Candidatus Polarisedimenticolaceae bacterium]
MNSSEIFALALGLNGPWEISNVEMKTSDDLVKELHLHIGLKADAVFHDKDGSACKIHDTKAKKWRHMNFFEHHCYIHCSVPRIRTREGKVRMVDVPWSRKGSGFTLLFEAIAMSLIENEMPINKAAKILGEHPNRIWRIFNYWINIAYQKDEPSSVTKLGFDETSRRKGHSYITVGVDLDQRRVVHVVKGKDAATIKEIKDYLGNKGVEPNQITQASIDLSPTFISGIAKHFPKAEITFDRFHVVKLLNEAMDSVRKQERKEHDELKGHKYTFLKNNLSDKRQSELSELITLYPTLGEAYRLKVLFNDLWDMPDKKSATAFIDHWFEEVEKSKIQPFMKFAKTVKSHLSGIINFVETRITNAILESINSKIQMAKRRARGYRNTDNFINMIYFLCSKLRFTYPLNMA